MTKINPEIFKSYDIRGLYPEQIDEEIAYKIGLAYAKLVKPKVVVIGNDVRECNISMKKEVIQALLDSGVEVIDVGGVATDMIYFAVGHYKYDGGVIISSSHNEKGWGGIKLVERDVVPIFKDNKMSELKELVMSEELVSPGLKGKLESKNIEEDYFDFLLSFVEVASLKPVKIAADANFGLNGRILEKMVEIKKLPIEIVPLNFEPNENFPKGRPDPMRLERRDEILELTKTSKADFGLAWDADGDRIFFCDNAGTFYETAYVTALMLQSLFTKKLSQKAFHDVRAKGVIKKVAEENGVELLETVVGRTFIMDLMRKENIYFGSEGSGHYFFQDGFYADNGMIPFLLIWEIISKSGKSFQELLKKYTEDVFMSGEFNTEVKDQSEKIKEVGEVYKDGEVSHLDGVTVEYPDWRFNLRASNTEPLIRCNVEGNSPELVAEKKKELVELLSK